MKIRLGYTSVDWNLVSWGIRHSTKGKWSHTVLILDLTLSELLSLRGIIPSVLFERISASVPSLPEIADSFPVYFESIGREDPITGKTGVRGPYPLQNLQEWVQDDPKRHHFEIQEIPDGSYLLDPEQIFREAIEDTKKIHYAPLQIVRNWLELRLGIGMPLEERIEEKDLKWTCSEFVARKIRHYALQHLRLGDFLFNEYVPSGTRGPGLYDMIAQVKP